MAQAMEMGGYGSVRNNSSNAHYRWANGADGTVRDHGNRIVSTGYVAPKVTYKPAQNNNTAGAGAGSGGGGNNYVPASSGDSGGYSGPSLADIMAAYREQQMQAAKAAMDSANGQIDASLNSALQNYGTQRQNATADYQTALNTSELNRFWAGKNLRETQANRGLLDSGAGRQDRLFMDSNYNNNVTKILNERAKAYQDIDNAIANARLQAQNAKAANYANYLSANASGMTSLLSSLLSGYSGNVSDLTSALANFTATPDATVQNAAQQTSPTLANILAAYDDQENTYKKKNTNYVY